MPSRLTRAAIFAAACALLPAAQAETLLKSDFEDGQTIGWSAIGNATTGLTRYAGNTSLRLAPGGTVVRAFATRGFQGVFVVVSFAARALGRDGRCVADLSIDRGHTWLPVFELRAGADDGVTLHRGGRAAPELADRGQAVLRLRNVAQGGSAECWADDIEVSARELPPPEAAATGEARATLRGRGLSAPELLEGTAVGPWRMTAFAALAAGGPPSHTFEGRLVLGSLRPGGGFRVLRDRYGDAKAHDGAAARLPDFDFALVQDSGVLIPVVRGAVRSEHPEWEFILEPGRAWDEPGDHGLTRATLPFALEERNANCMHNGALTFLFGDDGTISNAAFEIAQETCAYFQFDLWGIAGARYVPGAVADKSGVVAAYQRERSHRMPTQPMARLAEDHPGVDPAAFGSPLEVSPLDMTVFGVVAGGTHYVGGCETRQGPYPFCDELDLPSYSLAKSLVAGLAAMRIERLFPGAMQARIADYVPECAGSGWSDVTFAQVLDMATGHYSSDADQKDEDAPEMTPFFLAEDHATRVRFACTLYARREAPGRRWVYHTSDTYLLGTALAAFWKSKRGPEADFYRELLVEPIWNRLGLGAALSVARRTRDSAAQPFTGYGLTLTPDDIARLGVFIGAGHGAIDGEPAVDAGMLRAALQQDVHQTGLPASSASLRYKNGFWAWNGERPLGCAEPTWIPFMSGYGGITVALLPNGIVYYYVSDGGAHAWGRAAQEADRLSPFCRRKG